MADLELGLATTGIEEAVRDLGKIKIAENEIGAAAQSASRQGAQGAAQLGGALRTAGTAATNVGSSMQQAASRIQGTAMAAAQLSNALGQSTGGRAVGLVGAAAGAVAQGAALGATFGPGGVVVGALLGAIPLVVQLASAHRGAADAATQHAEALQSVRTAIAAMRQASLQSDIAAGVFGSDMTPERAREEREVRRARIVEIQREIEEQGAWYRQLARATSGISEEAHAERMQQLSREAEAARQQIETLDRLIDRQAAAGTESAGIVTPGAQATADAVASGRRARTPRRGGGGASDAADAAARARAEMTGGLLSSATAGGNFAAPEILDSVDLTDTFEAGAEAAERFEGKVRDLAEGQRELAAVANEAAKVFSDGWTSSLDDVRNAWLEANVALQAAGRDSITTGRLMERSLVAVGNSIADTIGGTMKGAFEEALGAWMDGSKSFIEAAEDMAKGVIKALTIESIVQAVVEVARALTSFASQNYAEGLQHLAAAAAWGAVAGVAGGVGAAVGAFGGGGGDKAESSGGADARALGSGATRTENATQNVTINVYPGGYITRDEVAGGLIDALNYGARRGQRLDSRLMRGDT